MWRKITNFLFDSVYQVVTWVWIAVSISAFFFFASNKSTRGMVASAISLLVAVITMLSLMAKKHFWDGPKQRAKVRPKHAAVKLLVDQPEDVLVVLHNHGVLDVKRLWLDGSTYVKPKTFTDPLERADWIRYEYLGEIAAGADITAGLRGNRAWTQKGVSAVESGELLIFHYGEGGYTDEAGNTYPISFCYRYEPGYPVMSTPHKSYWPEQKDRTQPDPN